METANPRIFVPNPKGEGYEMGLSTDVFYYCALHGKCPAVLDYDQKPWLIGVHALFYCKKCEMVLSAHPDGHVQHFFKATLVGGTVPRQRTKPVAQRVTEPLPRLWKQPDEMLEYDDHHHVIENGWDRCSEYPCDSHLIHEDGSHDCDAEGNDSCPRWDIYAIHALEYLQELAESPRPVKPSTIIAKLKALGEQA